MGVSTYLSLSYADETWNMRQTEKMVFISAEIYFLGHKECYIHFYYRQNEATAKELHILAVKSS
jgi:hypothetical protein